MTFNRSLKFMAHIDPKMLWLTSFLLISSLAMAIEEPKFNLIEKEGPFEIRLYAPKMIAEVVVTGNLQESSNKGFRSIADYIFGNNTAASGTQEKISMTAPVVMKAETTSTKETNNGWRMYFVMPSQYTYSTIPRPNNPNVSLREIGQKKVAVLRFSGLVNEEKIAKKTRELMQWIASKNLRPLSDPELARYNPPWTLPFLRRNEILIEIE